MLLPDLADKLNCKSDKFCVRQRFDGGMGTCYRIEDETGKSYALKVIHSNLLLDENSIRRYHEELKLWLTFSACSGIAEALCIVRINDIPCIVSSWMENGDMGSLIDVMTPSCFFQTMDRIISSLKWVNDKFHVIHRDLKPGNILLDEKNQAYVADWGLAKIINNIHKSEAAGRNVPQSANPAFTQEGAFMGTLLYASPEQLLGVSDIDHRSDIYSLGCIMYEWESGRPPFLGKTVNEIVSGHLTGKPSKLGGFFKSTNFKAESVIMKSLEKHREDRYQTYDALLADLRKVAAKHVTGFRPTILEERYLPINIGHNEFLSRLKSGKLGIVGTKGVGIASQEDITPYLKEAMHLADLGEHSKAIAIYKRLFDINIFKKFPDFGLHQHIAINLANELNQVGKYDEALNVILSISEATIKNATYYVNLSNIYLSLRESKQAVVICEEGLKNFSNDPDLIGNYTLGLSQIGRFDDAIKSANKRLDIGQDIHSLSEAAFVVFSYAEKLKNTNFPEAIEHYKTALSLYRKALQINPGYSTALYNVDLILFKMKRYVDSMNYGVVISKILKGTSETLAFYAARNMLWTSNFESGLKFVDNWLKTYPDSIMLKRVRAEILADGYVIGNVTKDGQPIVERSSFELFTQIVKDKENRTPSDIIYLAKIHCWMGEDDHIDYGLRLLDWGKANYPDNWKFNFYLAAFALKYNEPQKALLEARECVKKAPWRETGYNMLANAYSATEQYELAAKAKRDYERIKAEKERLYNSCKNL